MKLLFNFSVESVGEEISNVEGIRVKLVRPPRLARKLCGCLKRTILCIKHSFLMANFLYEYDLRQNLIVRRTETPLSVDSNRDATCKSSLST